MAVVIALICFYLYCLAPRKQASNSNAQNIGEGRFFHQQVQLPKANEHSDTYAMLQKFQALNNLDPQEFPFFPMESVRVATNDFSDSNKLGQGGFGPVYKVMA